MINYKVTIAMSENEYKMFQRRDHDLYTAPDNVL